MVITPSPLEQEEGLVNIGDRDATESFGLRHSGKPCQSTLCWIEESLTLDSYGPCRRTKEPERRLRSDARGKSVSKRPAVGREVPAVRGQEYLDRPAVRVELVRQEVSRRSEALHAVQVRAGILRLFGGLVEWDGQKPLCTVCWVNTAKDAPRPR